MEKYSSKWWAEEKDVYKHVYAVFEQIQMNQRYREQMNSTFSRLYSNLPPVALATNPYYSRTSTDNVLPNRLTLNVVKSCIDTAESKIATMKPRPYFLTEDGDWSQQNRAKKLTHFFDGLFDELKLYQKSQAQFKDGAIFGDGFLKYYIDPVDKKIKCERVFPDEIKVDDLEGIYGSPRSLYQLKLVSREVLKNMFPKYELQVEQAPRSKLTIGNPLSQADLITVVEAWHLPSNSQSNDGMHAICIETATLFQEEYTKSYFPFTKFSWGKRPYGYYGVGLAEDLVGIQIDINKTLRTIQIAQHLVGVPRVWVENSSKVNTDHLVNEIAAIGRYTGIPPIFATPQAVSPELYSHVETQIQRAYNVTGISQLSAANEKPSGLNSAVALRTYQNVETERFKAVAMRFEDMFMEATEILIDLCDELSNIDGKFSVKAPQSKAMSGIKWKDVKLDKESYILRKFPTSFLPQTPEGKLETIQELINAGMIGQEHARSLLDFPDLEAVESLENASRNIILKIIENIIDKGQYETPEPFFDLTVAQKLAQESYLKGKLNNVDDDKLELIRLFIADVQELKAATMPTIPMSQGTPAVPNPSQPQPPIPGVM